MADATLTAEEAVKAKEITRAVKRTGRSWVWFAGLGLLVAGVAAWFFWPFGEEEKAVQWETAPLGRGDIVLKATATGKLQPQRLVAIGAEVSGRIETVEVEANDKVTEGQVLARFNTEALDNSLEQAETQLVGARASVNRASATYEEARQREARVRTLVGSGASPASELETAKATFSRAGAELQDARSQLKLAQARVELAKTNRERAVITSPINGVVLKRNVEPGNTVASSFQSPELFLLAEDLSRMDLLVTIDEADIGIVRTGQKASFTVDAWPERTFEATVGLVHLYPVTTEPVVTYTAELQVDNAEELLRPGMSATATITTEKREGVLRVPAAALRFSPPVEQQQSSLPFMSPPRGVGGRNRQQQQPAGSAVWVLREGTPERVPVRTGRSDGSWTEILGGDVQEGDLVVLGQQDDGASGRGKRRSRTNNETTGEGAGTNNSTTGTNNASGTNGSEGRRGRGGEGRREGGERRRSTNGAAEGGAP